MSKMITVDLRKLELVRVRLAACATPITEVSVCLPKLLQVHQRIQQHWLYAMPLYAQRARCSVEGR